MSRAEFMEKLEYLLQDLSEDDREDGIAFYRDYLDEAGPEREEEVLQKFGSPERIASIIRSDLKEDMEKKKFNPINFLYNKENKSYDDFIKEIKPRIEFTILNCGYNCKESLEKLPLKRNKEILQNIINLGMMDKYEKVINSCNCKDKKKRVDR